MVEVLLVSSLTTGCSVVVKVNRDLQNPEALVKSCFLELAFSDSKLLDTNFFMHAWEVSKISKVEAVVKVT